MKKKIIIIINHHLYLNNYVNSGAFEKLETKYNCYYIIDNSISRHDIKRIIKKNKYKSFIKKIVLFYDYPKLDKKLFTFLFNRVQLRNRHKIKNIYYLVKNQLRFKLFYNYPGETLFVAFKRLIIWLIKYTLRILNLIFINNFFDNPIKNFIRPNLSLIRIFESINPDLIIIPFNGNHISIFDSIRYKKKIRKYEVFLLSENWDNIYSRYMINHPEHIGLWGAQSKKYLIKQNYRGKSHILGAPRLERYFQERNKKYKRPYSYEYAVFFDNASPRIKDNLIFLKNVDEYIERNKLFFKNFKILFRPHPYTFLDDTDLINFENYKNIILDPQLKSRYNYNLLSSKIRKSDFKYSIGLIKNAKFLICSATSVNIEASIFHKKIIIYTPKNNSYDKKNRIIDLWEHFLEVTKFQNINICDDEKLIGPAIKNLYLSKTKLNKKLIDKQREQVVFFGNSSYNLRLLNTVKKILS